MRADYDSKGKTLQIELEAGVQLTAADDATHPRAIVNLGENRPALIEVLQAADGVDAPLAAVADAYGLDLEALRAAAESALAVPDRAVVIDVGVRQ